MGTTALTRGRELKLEGIKYGKRDMGDRPHARARIEIESMYVRMAQTPDRPHARARIEMHLMECCIFALWTALTRGRELKLVLVSKNGKNRPTALTRGRELKYTF